MRPVDLALAPAALLEQDLKAPTDARPVEGLPLALEQRLQLGQTRDFHGLVDLAVHRGGGRAGPGRIFEGVGRGEPDLAHKIERRLEVGVGLAGIADDEVGRERYVGARGPRSRHDVEVVA